MDLLKVCSLSLFHLELSVVSSREAVSISQLVEPMPRRGDDRRRDAAMVLRGFHPVSSSLPPSSILFRPSPFLHTPLEPQAFDVAFVWR